MEATNSIITSCKKTYERFGDDISKEYYSDRVMYSLTGDEKYIHNIVRSLEEVKWLEKQLNNRNNRPVFIFGAGTRGKWMVKGLSFLGWNGLIDNDPKKQGQNIDGVCIYSVGEAKKISEAPIIVVPNKEGGKDIKKELADAGFDEKNILLFGEKYSAILARQYFDLAQLPHDKNEVYVDCGAYDGQTVIDFANWSGGNYSKIYCFEPDANNFWNCVKRLEPLSNNESIEVIQKGAWREQASLNFDTGNDETSSISDTGNSTIEVTSIDEALKGGVATFIKMDIEGAELEALHGAKETIRSSHPKLAICVYHKNEDIFTIPEYILSLYDGYSFYLRHYHIIESETVLYGIPEK